MMIIQFFIYVRPDSTTGEVTKTEGVKEVSINKVRQEENNDKRKEQT